MGRAARNATAPTIESGPHTPNDANDRGRIWLQKGLDGHSALALFVLAGGALPDGTPGCAAAAACSMRKDRAFFAALFEALNSLT